MPLTIALTALDHGLYRWMRVDPGGLKLNLPLNDFLASQSAHIHTLGEELSSALGSLLPRALLVRCACFGLFSCDDSRSFPDFIRRVWSLSSSLLAVSPLELPPLSTPFPSSSGSWVSWQPFWESCLPYN